MDGYPVPPPTMTDLYELTMAAGYWKLGRLDDQAIFTMFFRHAPFGGGFTLAAGLEGVVAFIEHYRFSPAELEHLAGLVGNDDRPLFEPAFLDYLADLRLTVDLDAMPEGTLAFPHEPLLRVTGSLLQGQLLESALLNLVNYPTLAATKAAHVVFAAGGAPVMEFGLRRAQGPDGGLTASRSAYLGGCAGTSNVLAGRLFGIPVRGTHAHSWILSFADEPTAFDAWAEVMPGNAVLLVDTYDTEEGIANAIATGRKMRERGQQLAGIRLDSGDLAYLSVRAREMLDAAGFGDTQVVASNDLDPRHDRVPAGAGRTDRQLGRRDEARRPATTSRRSAGSTSSRPSAVAVSPPAPGARPSRSARTRRRSPSLASSPSAATTTAMGPRGRT